MKRVVRVIFVVLNSIFLLLTLISPIISSYMQSYYKGLMDTMPENTQALLDKKDFWVAIGETKIFAILFLAVLLSFVIMELIVWIKKNKVSGVH